jgi:hypothetical protein
MLTAMIITLVILSIMMITLFFTAGATILMVFLAPFFLATISILISMLFDANTPIGVATDVDGIISNDAVVLFTEKPLLGLLTLIMAGIFIYLGKKRDKRVKEELNKEN